MWMSVDLNGKYKPCRRRHFQELHVRKGYFEIQSLGNYMSFGFVPNPAVKCLFFYVIMSESDMKRGTLFTREKCELSICGCPLSPCAGGALQIYYCWWKCQSTHRRAVFSSPSITTETWWKRSARQPSISPVIAHKATDISCRRTSWSAGSGTREILFYTVHHFFY